MTYLERRYPEKWGRGTDSDTGPKVIVQIGVRDLDVRVQIASRASIGSVLLDAAADDTH